MNSSITSTDIDDASFETHVLHSEMPVLVDFWAEWCGPCKMVAPVLEELANDYAGKVKIVKMNVDGNTTIPAKYSVRSIPTLILFKGGEPKAIQVGALSKAELVAFLDGHLDT